MTVTLLQRLAQQRFFDVVPCVLVTAKGVPDLATRQALPGPPVRVPLAAADRSRLRCRAFLSLLCAAFPHMRLLGLVDWNPVRPPCTPSSVWHRSTPSRQHPVPTLCRLHRLGSTFCASTALGANGWGWSRRTTPCQRWGGWARAQTSCSMPMPPLSR